MKLPLGSGLSWTHTQTHTLWFPIWQFAKDFLHWPIMRKNDSWLKYDSSVLGSGLQEWPITATTLFQTLLHLFITKVPYEKWLIMNYSKCIYTFGLLNYCGGFFFPSPLCIINSITLVKHPGLKLLQWFSKNYGFQFDIEHHSGVSRNVLCYGFFRFTVCKRVQNWLF